MPGETVNQLRQEFLAKIRDAMRPREKEQPAFPVFEAGCHALLDMLEAWICAAVTSGMISDAGAHELADSLMADLHEGISSTTVRIPGGSRPRKRDE